MRMSISAEVKEELRNEYLRLQNDLERADKEQKGLQNIDTRGWRMYEITKRKDVILMNAITDVLAEMD